MSSEQDREKNCQNCLHTRCMFHGEAHGPVYTVLINCWDNAQEVITRAAALAKGEGKV